jgi:hypothetical protein
LEKRQTSRPAGNPNDNSACVQLVVYCSYTNCDTPTLYSKSLPAFRQDVLPPSSQKKKKAYHKITSTILQLTYVTYHDNAKYVSGKTNVFSLVYRTEATGVHLETIRLKIKNSDGVRCFPGSSQSLSHRCSRGRKRNLTVKYKTKRGITTFLSNVEISLPLRNRRNSFFYSQSYSNDITLVLLAYHQSQGWTNIKSL